MPIRCTHSIEVSASPERAFAFLDDLPATPRWLAPCTAIEKPTPGPNAVGDKLKYSYKQGGQAGTMDGEILARTPNERLICRYGDKTMEVVVDFQVDRLPAGARLTHVIAIAPKTFVCRLMTPLIRLSLPRQTRKAMSSLKAILDSENK